MKNIMIALLLMSSFSAFAKDYSYTCAFEDNTYVEVSRNGKKFKLVDDSETVTYKVALKGALFGTDSAGNFVTGQLSLATKYNADTLTINYEIENGKDLINGQILDASLSLKDAPISLGVCIKKLQNSTWI